MDKQPSKASRFAGYATMFPGLHILWALLTFGYRFPHKRRGESLLICVFKSIVIFVFRFVCVLGAIWYLNEWISYIGKGENRPFNVLERQERRSSGIPVPLLEFYTPNPKTLTINSVYYVFTTGRDPLATNETEIADSLSISMEDQNESIIYNLTSLQDLLLAGHTTMESIEIEITQNLPPDAFQWAQVGIFHPWDPPTSSEEQLRLEDITNRFFFLPGQYVEISFIPLRVLQPLENPVTTRDKVLNFFGFSTTNLFYSYQSTVKTSSLPATYPNTTSVIILRPYTNREVLSYREEKVRFRDMLSSVGGLLGTVGGVIGFLFGASLLSPWGFVSGISIFRRRIRGSLAKAFGTDEGLSKGPFTTPFKETGQFPSDIKSQEDKFTLLKERIDQLEMVLKEYYLDGNVFEEYGSARTKLKQGEEHISEATKDKNEPDQSDEKSGYDLA